MIMYDEEFVIEFTKWATCNYRRLKITWISRSNPVRLYSTKELLEQFKKLKEENVQE